MAKKPEIRISVKDTVVFDCVVKGLQTAYKFIDKIWEKQDVDYAISSDEFKEYTKAREDLEKWQLTTQNKTQTR